MFCNLTAKEWLNVPITDISNVTVGDCWHWTNVSINEWIEATRSDRRGNFLRDVWHLAALIIMPCGIIGSSCSILSVWRKALVEKKVFYIWMLIIGVLDLLYALAYIPAALSIDRLFESVFAFSYVGTNVAIFSWGFICGLSLASDLCIVALSTERYLALCHPVVCLGRKIKLLRLFVAFATLVLSSLRFVRCGFESKPQQGPDHKYEHVYSNFARTDNFYQLVVFTDIITPFTLLILIVYFSSRIACSVANRRTSPANENRRAEARQEMAKTSSTMLRLLTSLFILFIFNEIAYCFNAVAFLSKEKSEKINFHFNYEELKEYSDKRLLYDLSMVVICVAEGLSRSLNFCLYCLFSDSIRRGFVHAIGCGRSFV